VPEYGAIAVSAAVKISPAAMADPLIACTSRNQVKGAERLPSYDPGFARHSSRDPRCLCGENDGELDERLAYHLAE
jgi:hypothetical protein